MTAIITDSAVALARLQRMLQYDQAPALSSGEVDLLLDEFQLASIVVRSTAYVFGDSIIPDPANGHWYMCGRNTDGTAGGTTSATAPTFWPLDQQWFLEATVLACEDGRYVVDGTVTWWELGPQPPCLWDLRAAATEGWRRKLGKVSGSGVVKCGRVSVDFGNVRQQITDQIAQYAPFDVG